MKRNPALDAACALLTECGVPFHVFRGSKHLRIEFNAAGHRRCVTIPGTPRCPRAGLNNLAQLRRALRADGVSA